MAKRNHVRGKYIILKVKKRIEFECKDCDFKRIYQIEFVNFQKGVN